MAAAVPAPSAVFETKATITTFGGTLLKLSHQSKSTGTAMSLNLYLPPSTAGGSGTKAPLLIYLSGLTCTPDNCTEKGFLQAHASRLGLALLWPDTSPRGLDLPGEHDSWDFGSAASFYVDARRAPWNAHYRMETYLAAELPGLVFEAYPDRLDRDRVSVAGHSMGGHGALTLHLKNPGMFRSVSAWAPIANPSRCPWGEKAFSGYLGEDRDEWRKHDATELVKAWKGGPLNCLIDVGTGDNFYKQGQLLPENFEAAAKESGVEDVTVRYHEGYDHSYFFISTFGEDHIKHHAKHLGLL